MPHESYATVVEALREMLRLPDDSPVLIHVQQLIAERNQALAETKRLIMADIQKRRQVEAYEERIKELTKALIDCGELLDGAKPLDAESIAAAAAHAKKALRFPDHEVVE